MIDTFKKNMAIVLKIVLLLLIFKGSDCLRNVRLIMPEAAARNQKVLLRCTYDLEQDTLYQVKWYRGDREFCRYAPGEVPPLKVFRIPGIEVERDETDAERLTMIPTTNVAHGRYSCEVSADAPSFQTSLVHGEMSIVELPTRGPELIGLRDRYRPGAKVKAECSLRNTLPPANLSFYINGEPASTHQVWHRVEFSQDGQLMNAFSTIQFVVQKKHFIRENVKVRCAATIYTVYYKSIEKCALREHIRTTPDPMIESERVVVSIRDGDRKRNKRNDTNTVPKACKDLLKCGNKAGCETAVCICHREVEQPCAPGCYYRDMYPTVDYKTTRSTSGMQQSKILNILIIVWPILLNCLSLM